MSEERQVVRPLTSEEVKDGIAQTIAEKVRESLNTTCWLYGMSWPKFKSSWKIDITLENFGEERKTSVDGVLHTHEFRDDQEPILTGAAIPDATTMTVEGEIPYTPPNVFRKEHGMAIPTIVKRDDGSTEQKAVFFRRTGRQYATSERNAD